MRITRKFDINKIINNEVYCFVFILIDFEKIVSMFAFMSFKSSIDVFTIDCLTIYKCLPTNVKR